MASRGQTILEYAILLVVILTLSFSLIKAFQEDTSEAEDPIDFSTITEDVIAFSEDFFQEPSNDLRETLQ